MRKERLLQLWFMLLAVIVAFVIPVQAVLNYTETTGMFAEPYARVFNMFWFFTIQSNILVGILSYLLYKDPKRNSQIFLILQHSALVAITVTGVVYHLLLAADQNLTGVNIYTNWFLHTIIPIMYVLGWLIFNVRGRVSWKMAWLSLVYPVLWSVAVLIRGPIIDYYPYPFMDVRDLGYVQTLTTMGFVTVFFVVLTLGYKMLDQLFVRFQNHQQ